MSSTSSVSSTRARTLALSGFLLTPLLLGLSAPSAFAVPVSAESESLDGEKETTSASPTPEDEALQESERKEVAMTYIVPEGHNVVPDSISGDGVYDPTARTVTWTQSLGNTTMSDQHLSLIPHNAISEAATSTQESPEDIQDEQVPPVESSSSPTSSSASSDDTDDAHEESTSDLAAFSSSQESEPTPDGGAGERTEQESRESIAEESSAPSSQQETEQTAQASPSKEEPAPSPPAPEQTQSSSSTSPEETTITVIPAVVSTSADGSVTGVAGAVARPRSASTSTRSVVPVAVTATSPMPTPTTVPAANSYLDLQCADFWAQAGAQMFFVNNPTQASQLNPDGDDQACEDYAYEPVNPSQEERDARVVATGVLDDGSNVTCQSLEATGRDQAFALRVAAAQPGLGLDDDEDGIACENLPLVVPASTPTYTELAYTGSPAVNMSIVGSGLALAGVGLVMASKRKRVQV